MQDRIKQARRIVVKIGSALLVDPDGGLRADWLDSLAGDIAALRARGQEVIIVSSGAIALGSAPLRLTIESQRLEESQAAAAVGQIRLAHAYQDRLGKHGIDVAQILLTPDDTEVRRRYLNARDTINTLLRLGTVPVINENDTVATAEIRYGDNDRLAARVAQMTGADCLILLSDVDGLFTADPSTDSSAELVLEVAEITPEIEAMAGKPKTAGVGKGGMITKLAAAKIAVSAGCPMLIVNGTRARPIRSFEETGLGTWFHAVATPLAARKQWIAGTLLPAGSLTIDDGAVAALQGGKSLLPAGVSALSGSFQRGDTVMVKTSAGEEIGRGLVAYSSVDTERIIGHKSSEIETLLGYRGREVLIHRDDLVLDASWKT